MNDLITIAGAYYHKVYPGNIIFYRLGDSYVTYQDDAIKTAIALELPIRYLPPDIPCLEIPSSNFFNTADTLSLHGLTAVAIISYDDDGRYSIPDINSIQQEQNSDC